MDLVGHGFDQSVQELGDYPCRRLLMQLGEGELRGSVDRREHVHLALGRSHFGNVDVEIADRIALELPFGLLVAVPVQQSGDAMPLQAAM